MHDPCELVYDSPNSEENYNAEEVSSNEYGGQENDAPTRTHRYPQRLRKAFTRFSINALTKAHDSDEPTTKDELDGDNKKN